MYDIETFSLDDMIRCGAALRGLGQGSTGMADTAERVVRSFYDGLARPPTGERSCALVRFFETNKLGELGEAARRFAAKSAGGAALSPETICFHLLASVGDEPSWCDPRTSTSHLAIALPSEEAVARMPMVAQLCAQLGIAARDVVQPDASRSPELAQRTYDVFFVERAAGCPWVPAQETFVKRYGIESVIGLGSVLPSGRVFVVLLFSKVHVPVETAVLFRPLALAVKLAVLPWSFGSRALAAELGWGGVESCRA